ncbi:MULTISPECIES: hypothetical protein [unclassified Serratia (in: enterobacteria)]|uniref:phage tail terminator protein n=1 Tax=unclassified Serratia (in: enterobacteria) TaxID=2647522 RepID=UPI00046B02D0|nr:MULTISPECIES: hypothetical protein [unclassified Serratia (in: enterobacteria)]
MITDYLFCEPLIVERLREQIPDLVEVTNAGRLAAIDTDNPFCPSVYVIYMGDVISPGPTATGGVQAQAQSVTQLWATVLTVYIADGRGIGQGVNTEAGPLMSKIIEALSGWAPDNKLCKPLSRAAMSLPVDYEGGYGYFPMVFQTQLIFPSGAQSNAGKSNFYKTSHPQR